MSKQKVTIEVDIPEGYEATGEFRVPCGGDFFLWNGPSGFTALKWQASDADICRIILRKKEPLAIQACRALLGWADLLPKHHRERFIGPMHDSLKLAEVAIADFEKERQ